MKWIVLVENHPHPQREDLGKEHGLSLWIQPKSGGTLLLDAGSSARFSENAERLGLDLSEVQWAVLSHHHRDHSGGLDVFFRRNSQAKLYLRPANSAHLWAKDEDGGVREIGLAPSFFHRFAHRLTKVYGLQALDDSENIYVLSEIVNLYPRPKGNDRLLMDSSDGMIPDDFSHELVLVIRESLGLYVFSSCSHHGILNIIQSVMQAFPNLPIVDVVGGFHLIERSSRPDRLGDAPEALEKLAQTLAQFPVQHYWTGHCTGTPAFSILKAHLGERLYGLYTGLHRG